VEGGPLPLSAVSDVPLSYGYDTQITWRNDSTGAVESTECETSLAATQTTTNGSFSFDLLLANSSCDRFVGLCSSVSGPFGPLVVDPTSGAPPGYLTSVTRNGSVIDLAYVAALADVALTPAGPNATYSVVASESIGFRALTGNGSPSPGSPRYTWNFVGGGWTIRPGPGDRSITLSASPNATRAQLSVSATLSVGGTNLTAGPENLSIAAIPTSISTAGTNRTAVDVGRPVTFLLSASGATGYDYTASVLPGLGLASRPLACESGPASTGTITLECTTSVVYPSTGQATPSESVSNGYSTATEYLAPVTIVSPPSVEVTPSALVGYAGAPLSLRVQALAGTGTGPYAQACFDLGTGATLCSSTPGPNWTFRPTWDTVGTYIGSAWTVDADGAIAALAVPVTIVEAPHLGPASAGAPTVPVGAAVSLAATLTGGLLPGAYWWNVSGENGSLAYGSVREDGTVAATWIPSAVGPRYVSLTVVDALGTLVEQTVSISVTPDPATSLPVVRLPPGDPVPAGTSIPLAWQAYDAEGALAVTYAPATEVLLTDPLGRPVSDAWVNASGVGPLLPAGPGEFGVPSAAWALGRLNLSVATVVAGTLEVALRGAGIPTSSPTLTVDIAPDLERLQLYAPDVVVAGDRTNRTFWLVRDVFGNPADGAALEVDFESSGTYRASIAPVRDGPNGTVGVWVNYTMPSRAGGSLEVRPTSLQVLLGPVEIPAATAGSSGESGVVVLAVALPVGAVGLGGALWARRRPRPPAEDALVSDDALIEFVTGRDRVIATVREAGAADLDHIEQAWGSSAPPSELADWVASLVADGTLGARTGPDGVARFCLAGPPAGPAHVILDEDALERATRARAELLGDEDPRDDGPGSR